MDGVPARDFMLEFMNSINILSLSFSRMAEDLIIFSSENFNYFELSDQVTTGSSIMPNKKNPDGLELIRAKTGRIIGNYTGLFTVLKALPSTYNKDLQEDKEKLFDSIDTIKEVCEVAEIIIRTMKVNENSIRKSIDPLSFATELADYLALHGVPFREAHHITGKIVGQSLSGSKPLNTFTESDLTAIHPSFAGIGDQWCSQEEFLKRRVCEGSTGIESVKNQIAYLKKELHL
jgi:argininosuccinate lyase